MSEQRTIRFGIIGTGSVAQYFTRGLMLAKGATLSAVLSRKVENAQAFANAFGGGKAYDDMAKFLADPEIDVVYIATPNNRHASDAIAAIHAGKAVLVEKPFATTTAEAESIIAAAKERRIFAMEAMWMRFMPLVQEAKRLITAGELGDVRFMTADFSVPTTFPAGSSFFDAAGGGGALLDRGVYGLSLADYLFGPPSDFKTLATRGSGPSAGIDEQAAVTLNYAGGKIAQIWTSVVTSGTNSATIFGTKGKLTLHEPFYRPHRLTVDRFAPHLHTPPGLPQVQSLKSKLKESPLVQKVGRKVQSMLKRSAVDRVEPVAGTGYHFEAEEVVRCLQQGKLESDIMPHAATLRIMKLMDDLRAQW